MSSVHPDGGVCSYCSGQLRVTRLTCEDCELGYEGDFHTPRLARLSREEQRFIELFILSSGSLKAVAAAEEISYPTVRNRLDNLIERLQQLREQDGERKRRILDDIEAGRVKPRRGMRMIEAL